MELFVRLAIVSILSGLCQLHVSSQTDETGPVDRISFMSQLQTLTQKVDNLTAHNHMLAGSVGRGVVFYAQLTTGVSGKGQQIRYDKVRVNIGNGYNPRHGVFFVPVSGIYLFNMYVCAPPAKVADSNLFVNNNIEGTIFAGDVNWMDCNSKTFVLDVAAGDKVYVKTHDSWPTTVSVRYVNGLPSFTGVLIQAHL